MTPPPLESVAPTYSYTEIEAAQLLRISRSTLSALRRNGDIRCLSHGKGPKAKKGIRYTKNHIEEYMIKIES